MNIQQFLAEHGLLAESINANALIDDFVSEMEKGFASRVSSLAMIPAYISADREIPAIAKPCVSALTGFAAHAAGCSSMPIRAVKSTHE